MIKKYGLNVANALLSSLGLVTYVIEFDNKKYPGNPRDIGEKLDKFTLIEKGFGDNLSSLPVRKIE